MFEMAVVVVAVGLVAGAAVLVGADAVAPRC